MENTAAATALVTQCVAAGYIGGLAHQHWADHRAADGFGGAFWLAGWTLTLSALFLINGLLPALAEGSAAQASLFLRAQVLGTSVVLSLPAIAMFTGGPPVRRWIWAAGSLVVLRAVLWPTTDLVFAHSFEAGVPQYGPLVTATMVAPVAVVTWYGLRATARMAPGAAQSSGVVAGAVSIVLLLADFALPGGRIAELLTVAWAVPLVIMMQATRVTRVRIAEQHARRQHGMRDSLAAISNEAWFTKDPHTLLQRAEAAARTQLDDPSIVGTLRPLAHGRFSTDFHSRAGREPDALGRGFLDDAGRLVSVTAGRLRLTDDLRGAAFTDSLTDLPNRRALERQLRDALARGAQSGDAVGVLYCDVDGFKQGNDQHGHAWGDHLLRRIARHLEAEAGAPTFVARFGGDEFVVVVESAGSIDDLVELATRLHTGPGAHEPDQVAPGLSVGIARWSLGADVRLPGDVPDPEQLLREANTAMVAGKRRSSRVVVFDGVLRARMIAEQSLRRELDLALVLDEFELYYQPIVDASTLEIVSVEALVRWQHPDGVRMPGSWLGFAEETGLIVPIGRRIVVAARAGARELGLPVAVNFAARQLAEPHFLDHLRRDWGSQDWHLLTLEITESALLEDLTHVIAALTEIRALGARVSIDDFGTGYSSFARLATLPVDVLKIDQAFVRDLDQPGGRAVVRAIVALAEAYRLDVIAEGVERVDQVATLRALGVPKLQGYLLGRPAPHAPAPVDLSTATPAAAATADEPVRRAASV